MSDFGASDVWVPREFFTPEEGHIYDECRLCGIQRRHAGNPDACGGHYSRPGCFVAAALPLEEPPA